MEITLIKKKKGKASTGIFQECQNLPVTVSLTNRITKLVETDLLQSTPKSCQHVFLLKKQTKSKTS